MSKSTTERSGPCSGFKVLDLSTMVSGPMGGQILSDLGADVIKVESLEGDVLRNVAVPYKGMSSYFTHFNRNKRSIAVDLKSHEGQDIVRRIAAECDVVIENFRPGVADRLGLGYSRLKDENEGLIYVSVNGFGDDGPYKDRPAYDHVVQAIGGFMPVQGATGAPAAIRSPVVDKVAAMSAAMSALAALLARQGNGGKGQRINVKMMDAWAAFILHEQMVNFTFLSDDAPITPASDLYRVFATRDGHVLGLIMQDSQFRGICAALKVEHLLTDERFANTRTRLLSRDAMNAELAPHIANLSTREFLKLAQDHEVPFAAVNDMKGFLEDPQAKANQCFLEFDDPKFGPMRNLNFFASFSETPLDLAHRAPTIGEHTTDILKEFGTSPNEVERLRSAKIVR